MLSVTQVPGNGTDTCACPDGFLRCAGRCWHWVKKFYDYTGAEQYCDGLGAHLATPRTTEENKCLDVVSSFSYNPYWLSYQLSTDSSYVGGDGCGQLNYTAWDEAEPVLNDDEHCMGYFFEHWFVKPCDTIHDVICQLPNCYQPQCQ